MFLLNYVVLYESDVMVTGFVAVYMSAELESVNVSIELEVFGMLI